MYLFRSIDSYVLLLTHINLKIRPIQNSKRFESNQRMIQFTHYKNLIQQTKNKVIFKKPIKLMSYSHRHDIFKCKKRLPIKSLQAAICNVALFKNMKQKQFRDTIYISYCEDGVILEAINQTQWDKACNYVLDFLYDKKIALLTYGFDKEVYEELIIKGLKQYTRRIKQQGDQCPYINIIHYQKLRKSCEYMDKQKYTDPLKYWESKFKTNPNFSFLIVEPKEKFYEVKRYLLQVLLKREIILKFEYLSLWEFLYLFYSSKNKEEVRELCEKRIIEAQIVRKDDEELEGYERSSSKSKADDAYEKFPLMKVLDGSEYVVKVVNYSDLVLNEHDIKLIKHTPNLAKLGLEYISSRQIEKSLKTVSKYLRGPQTYQDGTQLSQQKKVPSLVQIYQSVHSQLVTLAKPQQTNQPCYSMIPYKKCQKQKYLSLLQKLLKTTMSKTKNLEEINNELKKLEICDYDEMEFLSMLPLKGRREDEGQSYHIYKVSINDCPYMVVEYNHVPIDDLDTFILYLQQLKTYYCTYIVRFYGISIRYGQNIHQSHSQILQQANHPLLQHIQKSQTHSYKQLSKSKLQEYSYYLIFDYHHRNVSTLVENDLVLDNLQIANIVLQLLYLCQFLHSHDEPRCLGMLDLAELYWPLAVVLPYLGEHQVPSLTDIKLRRSKKKSMPRFRMNCSEEGFQGDVKLLGKLLQHLMTAENTQQDSASDSQSQDSFQYDEGSIDKQLQTLWKQMTKENKHQRITISRAITILQDILSV